MMGESGQCDADYPAETVWKILNMSRVEYFFSVKYSGLGTYFEGLNIWKNDKLRKLQEAYVSGHWGELTAFILHI